MALHRSSSQHQRDIVAMKRQIRALERTVALLEKKTWSEPDASAIDSEDARSIRLPAQGLASHRTRLGLTVGDYAGLIQISVPTPYNSENGMSRPRQEQLLRLAAVRRASNGEAQARLEQLG